MCPAQMSAPSGKYLPGSRTYFILQRPSSKREPGAACPGKTFYGGCFFPTYAPLQRPSTTTLTGFSPCMAEELCFRASLDGAYPVRRSANLDENEQLHLYGVFSRAHGRHGKRQLLPLTLSTMTKDDPVEYAAYSSGLSMPTCASFLSRAFLPCWSSITRRKTTITRIRQKSADLRRIWSQTALGPQPQRIRPAAQSS